VWLEPFVIVFPRGEWISQVGNFPFWEILVRQIAFGNVLQGNAKSMKKTRFTRKYKRLLVAMKAARKSAGLTQVQVARKFGTHASFVSKIESAERRIDVIELEEFCKLYGVSLGEFLKEAGIQI
jgi:ribosome-binding protein aMBF1 (putative translation factor)